MTIQINKVLMVSVVTFVVVVVSVSVTGYIILSNQDSTKTYSQENPLVIPHLIDSLKSGNNIELVIQASVVS